MSREADATLTAADCQKVIDYLQWLLERTRSPDRIYRAKRRIARMQRILADRQKCQGGLAAGR